MLRVDEGALPLEMDDFDQPRPSSLYLPLLSDTVGVGGGGVARCQRTQWQAGDWWCWWLFRLSWVWQH